MGVPKKRSTKGKQGRRRSHIKLTLPGLVSCTHCKKPKRPHYVCANCGYYKGRAVLDVLAKEAKKEKKKKERS